MSRDVIEIAGVRWAQDANGRYSKLAAVLMRPGDGSQSHGQWGACCAHKNAGMSKPSRKTSGVVVAEKVVGLVVGQFKQTGVGRVPTKTEAEYARAYLAGKDARYEAITFRLANGHRYTPDWSYWDDGALVCVEVKGSYRLGSYQRARLAFDQARIEFPAVRFVWAEKQKDHNWKKW